MVLYQIIVAALKKLMNDNDDFRDKLNFYRCLGNAQYSLL
jgi:hypothetical protein